MNSTPSDGPTPEEHGRRMPPPRIPPGAVGTAVPEPPRWSPHRPASFFVRWRWWIGVTALLTAGGLGSILLGRTAELRAVGWTLLVFGVGLLGLRVWNEVVGPRVALRRRTRWVRARQAAVGPRPDHPPNDR